MSPSSISVISYIQGCATGAIGFGECGPVWGFAAVAAVVIAAVSYLSVMLFQAGRTTNHGSQAHEQ